jgi:hypothetical protein
MSETADHPQVKARRPKLAAEPVAPNAARDALSQSGLSIAQIDALVDEGVIEL